MSDSTVVPKRSRRVVVVSAIILIAAIAAGIGYVFTNVVIPARERDESVKKLTILGIALTGFHEPYASFPAGDRGFPGGAKWFDDNGTPFVSWRVHVLLFLDHAPTFQKFRLDQPWDSPHNKALIAEMPAIYAPTSGDGKPGMTTFLASAGPNAVYEPGSTARLREISDGPANTILVVEVEDSRAVIWTKPDEYEHNSADPSRGLRRHLDGFINVLMADGSVTTLEPAGCPDVLNALFTRSGKDATSRRCY